MFAFSRSFIMSAAIMALAGMPSGSAQSPPASTGNGVVESATLGSTATADSLTRRSAVQESRVSIAMHAAAEPSPAFRYRLWPSPHDAHSGEAQTHFYRAILQWRNRPEEFRQRVDQWAELAWSELPLEEVEKEIELWHDLMTELDRMALCDEQAIDLSVRGLEGDQVYRFLLPELQEARALSGLLQLRSAVYVHQGDYEQAVSTWRTSFRLAALVGNSDFVVSNLVGLSICQRTFISIEQALSRPDCPNLYWALASLPRPVIDMRRSFELERNTVFQLLPLLRDAEHLRLSDAEWRQRIEEAFDLVQKLRYGTTSRWRETPEGLITIANRIDLNAAKRRLANSGWIPDQLSGMSRYQLVAIDAARELRYRSDRVFAPMFLPDPSAQSLLNDRFQELQQWIQDGKTRSIAASIAELVMPNLIGLHEAKLRSELVLNQLMTIEAIRMQMSVTQQIPDSLVALQPVPALPDPFTQEPFHYLVQESDDALSILLSSRAPQTWPTEYRERRLTFKKSAEAKQ